MYIQTIRQVEVVDGATIVSFRHNEKPLGAAFAIEGWTGAKLRPVVSLGKDGQVMGRPAGKASIEKHVSFRAFPELWGGRGSTLALLPSNNP